MVLCEVPPGASFKVIRVLLNKEVGRRLADMGFTSNTEGAVIRAGFWRGPLQIRIRGYDVIIRRCEAAGIEIEPLGDWSAVVDSRKIKNRVFTGPQWRQRNKLCEGCDTAPRLGRGGATGSGGGTGSGGAPGSGGATGSGGGLHGRPDDSQGEDV